MKKIFLVTCFSCSVFAFGKIHIELPLKPNIHIELSPLKPKGDESSKLEVYACSVNFSTKPEGEYIFFPWVGTPQTFAS